MHRRGTGQWSCSGTQSYKLQPPFALEQIGNPICEPTEPNASLNSLFNQAVSQGATHFNWQKAHIMSQFDTTHNQRLNTGTCHQYRVDGSQSY